MKYYAIVCALALASCSGNGRKSGDSVTNGDTARDTSLATGLNTPAQNMEYCFVHTDGTSAQDTTSVHLVINANKVSGDMNWIPAEKDARKGKLLGTLNGDKINAVWSFGQEGTQDTMAVEFKLSSQQLAQKPLVAGSNGRQQTDKKADYSVVYNLDNCTKYAKK